MPKPEFLDRISQEYAELVIERNRLDQRNNNKFVIFDKKDLLQKRVTILQQNDC